MLGLHTIQLSTWSFSLKIEQTEKQSMRQDFDVRELHLYSADFELPINLESPVLVVPFAIKQTDHAVDNPYKSPR